MSHEITKLLDLASKGDAKSSEQLFELIYSELHIIAKANRNRWFGDQTLNTTALIHEAFIKLQGNKAWSSRKHFYATAAKAMRQILVNYAERRKATKRGGDEVDLVFEEFLLPSDSAVEEAINLEKVLSQLESHKPRWCRIVECRFFAGMSIEETATVLQTSTATINREWRLASAYLYSKLNEQD